MFQKLVCWKLFEMALSLVMQWEHKVNEQESIILWQQNTKLNKLIELDNIKVPNVIGWLTVLLECL